MKNLGAVSLAPALFDCMSLTIFRNERGMLLTTH